MNAKTWQQQFCHSLFHGLKESLQATLVKKHAHQHQQRFRIYQNNVFYSLSQALGELYPVVKRLVGDEFFNALARVYIEKHPPKKAAMVFFAQDFPDFIKTFEHTQDLLFLVDIAKLELARHKAYHAPDLNALEPSDFKSIQADVLGGASLKLHPSVYTLESQYPIFSIWQENQSDEMENSIDLNHPEQIIVVRQDYEVTLFAVDGGTYEFYRCLEQGLSVNESAALAVEVGETDIAHAIALGINNGFITEIIV